MLRKNELSMIFPRFVLHSIYDEGKEFNDELHKLGREDCLARRLTGEDERSADKRPGTHLAHQRYNFLQDTKSPVVRRLIEMYDETARNYLRAVYNYDHTGDLEMMADTFLQRRAYGENVGINAHIHLTSQIVVTYYPRVDRDENETNSLRRGNLKFYDPQMINGRHWPNNNPNVFANSWFDLEPKVGSMIAFEGFMPHDSGYFDGEERLCIPCMINVITPRSHIKTSVKELLKCQTTP
jgi:hypothetical protein